ncbi:MAG: hypothetical protein ACJATT_002888 [Myxococcota bacterium]|jgi:hypothetical protein
MTGHGVASTCTVLYRHRGSSRHRRLAARVQIEPERVLERPMLNCELF